MKIPQVKLWQIKTIDGRTYLVWGPTKLLAKLNFARDLGFPWIYAIDRIKSISVCRH